MKTTGFHNNDVSRYISQNKYCVPDEDTDEEVLSVIGVQWIVISL